MSGPLIPTGSQQAFSIPGRASGASRCRPAVRFCTELLDLAHLHTTKGIAMHSTIAVHRVRVTLLLACLALPFTAAAGGSITISRQAAFDPNLRVPDAVRAECDLPNKVSKFVQEYSEKGFDKVTLADNVSANTQGKALALKITDVLGTAGGAWSGYKQVTVEGTLWDNGKVIGTFKGTRHSGGGAFGGYKGTCAILGRCTKAIGKDVADWLQSPTMNARLGDAK